MTPYRNGILIEITDWAFHFVSNETFLALPKHYGCDSYDGYDGYTVSESDFSVTAIANASRYMANKALNNITWLKIIRFIIKTQELSLGRIFNADF